MVRGYHDPRPRKPFHVQDIFPVGESNPGPNDESLVSRPLGYQAPTIYRLPIPFTLPRAVYFMYILLQNVYLLDTGVGCMVWVGSEASPDEKKNAMGRCHVSTLGHTVFTIISAPTHILKR